MSDEAVVETGDVEVTDAEVTDAGVAGVEVTDAEVTDAGVADVEVTDAEVTDAEVGDVAIDVAADAPPVKKRVGAREWMSANQTTLAKAAVVAFVAAGAFAGATAAPYVMQRATVATKLTIARTAADAINTLWSYTPEDMDKLPDRSARYLGGDFEEQYRKYVDAIAATNKQAKVTSSTKVVGAAVESLRPDANEATAIVYTNTTTTTPQNNNIPSMKYLSYRLELRRYGRDWRVTKMTTVTSLNLTPKLGM